MRRYTVQQVADIFDVTAVTVRSWINKGDLKVTKEEIISGGPARYKTHIGEDQLRRYIDKHPKYEYVREKLFPKDVHAEERRLEINECFTQLKRMKNDVNALVVHMNVLIEHLNELLKLEKGENEEQSE